MRTKFANYLIAKLPNCLITFPSMPASDQGALSGRYTVIPRTLIFVTFDQKLLLLKGAPHKRLWANLYNGVGGHIEKGEDVLTAARRELAEEAGIRVSKLWICGTILIDAGENIGIAVFVLKGEANRQALQITQAYDSPEGSLEWVSFSQISALPVVEDLNILLPRLLEMKPGDPPFAARYDYDENQKLRITFGS